MLAKRRSKERRITLGDSMVLVAGAAFSLWLYSLVYRMNLKWSHTNPGILRYILIYFGPANPVLLVSSLGTLAIRLLRPRPGGLRLRRQPGYVASLAALFMSILSAMSYLMTVQVVGQNFRFLDLVLFITRPKHIALGVALAWSFQLILGAWRPEKTWVDRLGRGVGWAWIFYGLILWALEFPFGA